MLCHSNQSGNLTFYYLFYLFNLSAFLLLLRVRVLALNRQTVYLFISRNKIHMRKQLPNPYLIFEKASFTGKYLNGSLSSIYPKNKTDSYESKGVDNLCSCLEHLEATCYMCVTIYNICPFF